MLRETEAAGRSANLEVGVGLLKQLRREHRAALTHLEAAVRGGPLSRDS